MNENQITSASYIVTFFEEVGILTANESNYVNILLELATMSENSEDFEGLPDHHKQVLSETVGILRASCRKCYIMYSSIAKNTKNESKEVKSSWEKINNDKWMIERKPLFEYVIALNDYLVSKTMKNLLETSKEVVQNVYGN